MGRGNPLHAGVDLERALSHCREYWEGRRTGPVVSAISDPTYRQMGDGLTVDLDAMADAAAACLRADAAEGDPFAFPAVVADFGTISTARLYGGRVLPARDGGKVHIEPVARRPDDLARLQPQPFEESDFQRAVDLWQRVCDRLGSDQIGLRTPDFQGPLNTLALVMDQQEMLVAMIEDPDAIHAALASITTTLITYHQRLRRMVGPGRVVGSIWPYTVLPDDLGASLTEDLWPLLGADLCAEFGLPCLRRIADAFGGVQIHCCGTYAHHLPALKASGVVVRGLEFHHPFTAFESVYTVFGDSIVYIPYRFGSCRDFPDMAFFAEALLRQGSPETRFWFATTRGVGDAESLRRVIARERASNKIGGPYSVEDVSAERPPTGGGAKQGWR